MGCWDSIVGKPPRARYKREVRELKMVRAMEIEPADFDVFRNEVLDVPEQACTNQIECSVHR
jgi:hypothetical protein